MAELGNFTINITCPDTSDIEAFGELIGKYVEEQYKKLLEKESAKEKSYDDYLKEWKTIISETSLGKKVCCGFSVGIGPENKMPHFIVQDGQVYINQATIKDATIRYDNYKEAPSGWKLGKKGELEQLRDTVSALTDKVAILEKFPVKIEDGTLKVFDENGTVRVQVFNFKEKQ